MSISDINVDTEGISFRHTTERKDIRETQHITLTWKEWNNLKAKVARWTK